MFNKVRNSLLAATAVLAVAAGLPNIARADLIQVGFLLDSSGSIGISGWGTIKSGLAAAIAGFVAPSVADTYQLTVMSFSSGTDPVLSPTVITSGNLASLQATINAASFLGDNTNYKLAFTKITDLMATANTGVAASYINFATDGQPNEGDGEQGGIDGRDYAIDNGIDNISIEGIGGGVVEDYLTDDICYPQACTTLAGADFPAKGFYVHVANVDEYKAAVDKKVKVITGVPEPASLAVLGSALLGFGAIRRRQRHNAA